MTDVIDKIFGWPNALARPYPAATDLDVITTAERAWLKFFAHLSPRNRFKIVISGSMSKPRMFSFPSL
jgi:hypothetical protein